MLGNPAPQAAAVKIFTVLAPSPPVPTISSSGPGAGKGLAFRKLRTRLAFYRGFVPVILKLQVFAWL